MLVCHLFFGSLTYPFKNSSQSPDQHQSRLNNEYAKDWPSPGFTICPDLDKLEQNQNVLKQCNIKAKDYKDEGQWTGSGPDNCTDPKVLYDNAISKLEDFLWYVQIKFHLNTTIVNILPNSSSWTLWTTSFYKIKIGHCYELQVPEDLRKYAVKQISFYIRTENFKANKSVYVAYHAPKNFITGMNRKFKRFGNNQRKVIRLDYEINYVLVLGGQQCNPDPGYSRDACFQAMLFNQSMTEFGCTTPWGTNKDHICTNATLGKAAHELYRYYFDSKMGSLEKNATIAETCPKSCTIMKFQNEELIDAKPTQKDIDGKRSASLHLKFEETITVTEDQYYYIWLNLVAEVGGYMGLFLGYSVYQITDLVEIFFFKG